MEKMNLKFNLIKLSLIIIGIILIFDGIISIIVQINDSSLFQVGRIVRIMLGVIVIICGMLIDKEVTIVMK